MRAFAWFLGLILLALAVMAGLTYPAWQLLHPAFGFPFHRVADRLGMITLLVGFLLVARRLRLADRVSLGFGLPPRQFLRETGIGFAIGVLLMGLIIAIMLALHLRLLRPGVMLNWMTFGKLAAQGLLSGIAVAASQGFAIANNACTVTIAPKGMAINRAGVAVTFSKLHASTSVSPIGRRSVLASITV